LNTSSKSKIQNIVHTEENIVRDSKYPQNEGSHGIDNAGKRAVY